MWVSAEDYNEDPNIIHKKVSAPKVEADSSSVRELIPEMRDRPDRPSKVLERPANDDVQFAGVNISSMSHFCPSMTCHESTSCRVRDLCEPHLIFVA